MMPFAAFVFMLAGLSSMGMPGFAGFWAEFNIFMGMWDRFPLISILAAVSIPITAAYILRAVYTVFFGEVKDPSFFKLPKLTWQEYVGAIDPGGSASDRRPVPRHPDRNDRQRRASRLRRRCSRRER